MKKIIYKYLVVVTILVMIIVFLESAKREIQEEMISQIGSNIFEQDGSKLTEEKNILHVTEKVKIGNKYPLEYMYKVEDEKADLYTVSYKENKLEVGDTINIKEENKYVSDQLFLLFRESYPNVSVEEMGLKNEEEAYQALQLAIWEISARTGEADSYSELSYIDSVKEEVGLKNVNSQVFKKAKDLVNYVEEYTYNNKKEEINLVPTLVIGNAQVKDNAVSIEDDYMVGPYSYEVEAGILSSTNITITDEEGNDIGGKAVDINGFEIKDLTTEKKFYIRFPKKCNKVKFNIQTEIKRLVPTFYENQNCDYVANTYVKVNCSKDLYIETD